MASWTPDQSEHDFRQVERDRDLPPDDVVVVDAPLCEGCQGDLDSEGFCDICGRLSPMDDLPVIL